MTLRTSRRLIWLVFALAACARAEPPRGAREEAEVYAAMLDSVAAAGTGRLVVRPVHADPILWLADEGKPGGAGDSASAVGRLLARGVAGDLARDFVAANLRRDSLRALPPHARLRLDFDTLPAQTEAERDSVLRFARGGAGAGFEPYQRAYPGAAARVALSHVGFSRDGTQALVYYQSYCGMLCAGGSFVTLHRTRGGWRIVEWYDQWVS